MERNKQTILASGLDPELKRLRRLQAIKSVHRKKYEKAMRDIDNYWDEIISAATRESA